MVGRRLIEVTDAVLRLRQPGWVRPATVAACIGKGLPAMDGLAAVPGAEPGPSLAARVGSRGKAPRGWWGYPVDRHERAIGRQVEVPAVDR